LELLSVTDALIRHAAVQFRWLYHSIWSHSAVPQFPHCVRDCILFAWLSDSCQKTLESHRTCL